MVATRRFDASNTVVFVFPRGSNMATIRFATSNTFEERMPSGLILATRRFAESNTVVFVFPKRIDTGHRPVRDASSDRGPRAKPSGLSRH